MINNSHGKRMVREDLIKILENIENNGIAKVTTSNIKSLTNEEINSLNCGDIVAKTTGDQKHAYIVSYKEDEQGICLTYADATYLETISYDYVDGNWVYNSQDSTVVASKDYVDSLLSGALKRAIVETLPTEDIDTNTIYMVLDSQASVQENVYNEYLYINNSWELIGTTQTSGEVWENNLIIKNAFNKYVEVTFFSKEQLTSSNAISILTAEATGTNSNISCRHPLDDDSFARLTYTENEVTYKVMPYSIRTASGNWYVFAYALINGEIKTVKITFGTPLYYQVLSHKLN